MRYAYSQDNSKAIKLTIDQSLADDLDRVAKDRFTSRLGLIRYALREWIFETDRKQRKT